MSGAIHSLPQYAFMETLPLPLPFARYNTQLPQIWRQQCNISTVRLSALLHNKLVWERRLEALATSLPRHHSTGLSTSGLRHKSGVQCQHKLFEVPEATTQRCSLLNHSRFFRLCIARIDVFRTINSAHIELHWVQKWNCETSPSVAVTFMFLACVIMKW